MCRNGIHCCKQAMDCLDYYPLDSRFCEVLPSGEVITEGDKTVCRGITVVREVVGDRLSDIFDGPYEKRHANGQLRQEFTYKDMKREGPCKCWWENGRLMREFSYKDGKQEGPYTSWYDDGQLWIECTFKDGKLDGPFKSWWGDGSLQTEYFYKDGVLDIVHACRVANADNSN